MAWRANSGYTVIG